MHLPRRCPIPDTCGVRWHFTGNSIDRCLDLEEEERSNIVHETWQETLERREREAQDDQLAAALVAHVPATLSSAEDLALSFHGEQQLLALSPWQIPVVGLLTTTSIYHTNRLLRRGNSLEGGAGAAIDWAGYPSNQAFVNDVHTIFDDLKEALVFKEPMRLFRGVTVPKELHESIPDIAGISGYILKGTAWNTSYIERGFGFATTEPEIATQYPLGSYGDSGGVRVLIELEATSGLCLPRQGHRSVELFELTYYDVHLSTTACQVIFPPDTHWEVTAVDRESDYDVPLVRMKQKAA